VDGAASGNQRPRLALMKTVRRLLLQSSAKVYFHLLLVAATSLLFFLDVRVLVSRSIDWIRQGFLVVLVDSESFIRSCF
jgi:hypothetical protein